MAKLDDKYQIPVSFMLGGNRWRVIHKEMRDYYGECDCDRRRIYISTRVEGMPTSRKDQYMTYIHELGHAILHVMGYPDDERMVMAVEQLVFQVLETQRFKTVPQQKTK